MERYASDGGIVTQVSRTCKYSQQSSEITVYELMPRMSAAHIGAWGDGPMFGGSPRRVVIYFFVPTTHNTVRLPSPCRSLTRAKPQCSLMHVSFPILECARLRKFVTSRSASPTPRPVSFILATLPLLTSPTFPPLILTDAVLKCLPP